MDDNTISHLIDIHTIKTPTYKIYNVSNSLKDILYNISSEASHQRLLRHYIVQISSIANLVTLQLDQSALSIERANALIKYTAIYMGVSIVPMMVMGVGLTYIYSLIDNILASIAAECMCNIISSFVSSVIVDFFTAFETGELDLGMDVQSIASTVLGSAIALPMFRLNALIVKGLSRNLSNMSKISMQYTFDLIMSPISTFGTEQIISKIYNQKFDPNSLILSSIGTAIIGGAGYALPSIMRSFTKLSFNKLKSFDAFESMKLKSTSSTFSNVKRSNTFNTIKTYINNSRSINMIDKQHIESNNSSIESFDNIPKEFNTPEQFENHIMKDFISSQLNPNKPTAIKMNKNLTIKISTDNGYIVKESTVINIINDPVNHNNDLIELFIHDVSDINTNHGSLIFSRKDLIKHYCIKYDDQFINDRFRNNANTKSINSTFSFSIQNDDLAKGDIVYYHDASYNKVFDLQHSGIIQHIDEEKGVVKLSNDKEIKLKDIYFSDRNNNNNIVEQRNNTHSVDNINNDNNNDNLSVDSTGSISIIYQEPSYTNTYDHSNTLVHNHNTLIEDINNEDSIDNTSIESIESDTSVGKSKHYEYLIPFLRDDTSIKGFPIDNTSISEYGIIPIIYKGNDDNIE